MLGSYEEGGVGGGVGRGRWWEGEHRAVVSGTGRTRQSSVGNLCPFLHLCTWVLVVTVRNVRGLPTLSRTALNRFKPSAELVHLRR